MVNKFFKTLNLSVIFLKKVVSFFLLNIKYQFCISYFEGRNSEKECGT